MTMPPKMSATEASPRTDEQGCCQSEVLTPEQERIRDLERDRELLLHGCIIEIAVRNPSVADHMSHWEGRAIKAERELATLSADGWRMVPVEPTLDQWQAGSLCLKGHNDTPHMESPVCKAVAIAVYKAMLNASPPDGERGVIISREEKC